MSIIKKTWFILSIALLVLCATRLYALCKVGTMFHYPEGIYVGNLAKDLLDGAGWLSIFDRPQIAAGGYTTIGYPVALSFLLFGDTFFSLTLIPLLFSMLIMAVFYSLLERHFGRPAALIFSFLFIFMPPSAFRYSLDAHGFHFQDVLFSALGLYSFFSIFFDEANYATYRQNALSPRVIVRFFLLGAVSGFGVYFCYDYLMMLLTLMIAWFILDRKCILNKYFYFFSAGFVIGFIPWLAYNMRHDYAGAMIRGGPLLSCFFLRGLQQSFHSFRYLVTYGGAGVGLGSGLYTLTVISVFVLIVSNWRCLRHPSFTVSQPGRCRKELIIVGFVGMFIATWSLVHLPVVLPEWSPANHFLSDLTNKMYHLYPFLFVLVALSFNKLWPLKQDRFFLPRAILTVIGVAWIIALGVSHYMNVCTSHGHAITPWKIKGYESRFFAGEQNPQKITVDFVGNDIARLTKGIYFDSGQPLFDTVMKSGYCRSLHAYGTLHDKDAGMSFYDPVLDEQIKPDYYLARGLNTGDFLEGFDIGKVNRLIAREVPYRYRHYVYEGIAVSLLNRRYGEILAHADFIQGVPAQYRHYFLLELGRVMGTYLDGNARFEVFDSIAAQFPVASRIYLYRGLMGWLLTYRDRRKDFQFRDIVQQTIPGGIVPAYFYYTLGWSTWSYDLPDKKSIDRYIKKYGLTEENGRYFYYGMIGSFLSASSIYDTATLRQRIQAVKEYPLVEQNVRCEGLGLRLGYITFGHINRIMNLVEPGLNKEQLAHFYYGYALSLKGRYGLDRALMADFIVKNVPRELRSRCFTVIATPEGGSNSASIAEDTLKTAGEIKA